jgi:phosphate/sulfate permease
MFGTELLPLIGFCLAAYAIVANDAIQTLGTFIASNQHRKPWVLWLFSSSVLLAVLISGWYLNSGDPAYGRLEKFPEPIDGVSWIHIAPLIIILLLTRFGIPVSTTFLVLIVFAPTNLEKMLTKSALGYVVAMVSAYVLYRLLIKPIALYFERTRHEDIHVRWVFFSGLPPRFFGVSG